MTTHHTEAADEASLRATIDNWSRALGAKDVEGVLSHYAPNATVFSLAPPLVSDGEGLSDLAAWFSTWRGPIGFETRDLSIAAGGDIAFCHGLVRMTGTKTDGQSADLWFRRTLGWRRIGGAWRIVHEHESVPFHMDGSFKAAVNLRP